MIRGFYSATQGIKTSQVRMDTLANNMANVGTTGFKPITPGFSDTLYANLDENVSIGSGVKQISSTVNFAPGTREHTGEEYDFFIEGDGFFAVGSQEDGVQYTRNGRFSLSHENGQNFLVTADGQYVLDKDLQRIVIGENTAVEPGVFGFANPYALQLTGSCRFAPNEMSGQAETIENAVVINGCLESSAVDMVGEISRMIEAQRAFQFNARMIQVSDEIEQIASTLR
ncbi:MAG: flagellar hook-basal body protein [Clostridiales bacterium]|nr:flagellar hook-basal body protein [Clostridiales bacterium]